MKLNTKEKVIKYLLTLKRTYRNHQTRIVITKDVVEKSNFNPDVLLLELYDLDARGFILIDSKIGHKDFTLAINIVLNESILNYFENKKESKILKRNHWIQFWIPVSISILALVVSIIGLK